MAQLASLIRHPVKAIGYEPLDRVALTEGRALPFDRHWAVAHTAAKFEGQPTEWQRKMNFLRGVTGAELMAIAARTEDATGKVTFTHPKAAELTVDPMAEQQALIDWLTPLWPEDQPQPDRVVHVPGQAMTDWPDPFVSILGTGSLDALSDAAGTPMSPHRFRGNLWIEGWAPLEEFDLIGRTLRIGQAELEIRERITRCKATHANPETGQRDVDTMKILRDTWGHQDFGVYAIVTRSGEIAPGDEVTVL
ncbi:MOSC domain-containing protein [Pseudooceanicola sp. C21-150M6]|uniref:MOSC domain-containing protein n=1 Tax=Pseudooceanicola sp. C21-150M6 TaxID=3434355 RepID=UPI003D7FE144